MAKQARWISSNASLFSSTIASIAGLALVVATACGGGQKADEVERAAANPASDLDTAPDPTTEPAVAVADPKPDATTDPPTPGDGDGDGDGDGAVTPDPGGDGDGDAPATQPSVPDGPPVTFEIKNTWDKDLVLNLDAGWRATIVVYSGKPPDAVNAEAFPKHCTSSCDAERNRCPVCRKPTTVAGLKKAEQREVIEPGKSLEVPWEAVTHKYEKTRAAARRCDCHRAEPVADATYSVMICGLRLSKRHKTKSKLQCETSENAITLPAEAPQRVVVEFPEPK